MLSGVTHEHANLSESLWSPDSKEVKAMWARISEGTDEDAEGNLFTAKTKLKVSC